MKNLISIVIPTRNSEKTIYNLLKSIQNLKYKNFEVIVVDSSDKELEIPKKYLKKVRIVRIENKGKQTVNLARNIGIKQARGEIIALTDSDCIVTKDWLNQIVKNFSFRETGAVGGSVRRYREDIFSKFAEESIMPIMRYYKKKGKIDLKNFHKEQLPLECNIAFRKTIFKKIHYNENTTNGLNVFWDILKSGYKIAYSPDSIVRHDIQIKNIFDAIKKYFKYGKGCATFVKKNPLAIFSISRIVRTFFVILFISISLFLLAFTIIFKNMLTLSLLLIPAISLLIYHMIRHKENISTALCFIFLYILLYGLAYPAGFLYSILSFNLKKIK